MRDERDDRWEMRDERDERDERWEMRDERWEREMRERDERERDERWEMRERDRGNIICYKIGAKTHAPRSPLLPQPSTVSLIYHVFLSFSYILVAGECLWSHHFFLMWTRWSWRLSPMEKNEKMKKYLETLLILNKWVTGHSSIVITKEI